jgi:cbb3-type cytochrome oxidase subunit 3
VALIFSPLFILSRKLKNPQNVPSVLKWAGVAASLYVLGFWVRHALMWAYAISPLETQLGSLARTVGFVNSWLTLMIAAVVCAIIYLTFRQKNKLNIKLAGISIISMGGYFLIYDLVSVWDPIYRAFLPLTDFWMISLLVLGFAILVDSRQMSTV